MTLINLLFNMKIWKLHLFLCILLFSSFVKTSEFLYDSENDIIYFNNKKYVQLQKENFQDDHTRTISLSEEDLHYLTIQDGSSFYYYVFCIICKSNRLI
jgi:hypothetical protein